MPASEADGYRLGIGIPQKEYRQAILLTAYSYSIRLAEKNQYLRKEAVMMNIDDARNELRDMVKKYIPVTDYLEKSKSGMYCCPYCDSGHGADHSGALKVYPDTNTFTCHKCKKSGDSIALHMQVKGTDYNTALRELSDQIGYTINRYSDDDYRVERTGTNERKKGDSMPEKTKSASETIQAANKKVQDIDMQEYYKQCAERITDPAAMSYLIGRGFSEEFILDQAKQLKIGYDPESDPANFPEKKYPAPRIIFMVNNSHFIGRSIQDNVRNKKLNNKGCSIGIYHEEYLDDPDSQYIFVFEGASDCLSAIACGKAAIALNSVDYVKLLLDHYSDQETNKTMIICLDNESDAGKKEVVERQKEKLKSGLDQLDIHWIEYDVLGEYHDANDRFVADRDGLRQALTDAEKAAVPEKKIYTFLREVQEHKYEPIPTYIPGLDRMLDGGIVPGTLVTLSAMPGAGKTALISDIFELWALNKIPGIYYNFEMSLSQLYCRSIARQAKKVYHKDISSYDIFKGYQMDADTWKVVENSAELITDYEEYLKYNPGGIDPVIEEIDQAINLQGERAIKAGRRPPNIAIDYLHLIRSNSTNDPQEVIKKTVATLKKYAMKYNVIAFLISAQSRENNKMKGATLFAGRDSSSIEYTSDIAMQLKFPEETQEDQLENTKEKNVLLYVTKNRFGYASTKKENALNFRLYGPQCWLECVPVDNIHGAY